MNKTLITAGAVAGILLVFAVAGSLGAPVAKEYTDLLIAFVLGGAAGGAAVRSR